MKKYTSRIGLMITAMVLGLAVPVFAQDVVVQNDESESSIINSQEIKASKETLDKANAAIARKDYQSAIVYLSAYLNYKTKKYEIYKLRGECFYALRQYGLAQKDFQTAIDLKTSDDKFMTGTKVISAVVLGADKEEQYQNPELGNLYGELMYAQKAQNNPAYELSYQKAGEYNSHIYLPTPKKADINKINCPEKYGKVFNPQGIDATIYGAVDDITDKNYHDAVFKTQEIISEYPKYYLGYYLNGVALVGLEKDDEAIIAFDESLKRNPYDFESMASLGQIYYNKAEKTFDTGASEKSLEYFEQALKYNRNCPTYSFYAGLNKMLLKNYEAAITDFNAAILQNPSDYGSIYYKSIAQYVTGDYESVIDNTTKLLYKRVSNYNSVLYLRALAEYELGKSEDAIADLEKIHNSIDYLYSDEVKAVSEKDKVLDTYIYYLKSKILKDKGFGVVADLNKAYKNPVIAALANTDDVSFNMSLNEIENQYDYMQTTFADKNIKISYQNPDYRITTSKDIPIEDNNKIVTEDIEVSEVEFVPHKEEPIIVEEPINKDVIGESNDISIAQMLASNSLPTMQEKNEPSLKIEEEKKEPEVQEIQQEQLAEVQDKKDTVTPQNEDEQFIIIDEDTIVFTAPVQKKVESFDLKYDENSTPVAAEEKIEPQKDSTAILSTIVEPLDVGTKVVAPEIKDTDDFVISYLKNNDVVSESEKTVDKEPVVVEAPLVVENPIAVEEKVKEEIPVRVLSNSRPIIRDKKEIIEEENDTQPTEVKVVEKYADVNLDNFSIPSNKVLNINADDEVIVFQPKTLRVPTVQPESLSSDFSKIKNRKTTQEEIVSSQIAESETESQGSTELVVSQGVEIITDDALNESKKVDNEEKIEEQSSLLAQEVQDNVKKLTDFNIKSDLFDSTPEEPQEVVEQSEIEQEDSILKVKKAKKHWFSKKEKATTDEIVIDNLDLANSTGDENISEKAEKQVAETKKSKKIKKNKKQKEEIETQIPDEVEEIYNEPVQEENVVEKKKFKLFSKKDKKVTEVETFTDTPIEKVSEDASENVEAEVQEVKAKTKKFNWFRKNKKATEEVSNAVEETELLPIEEVKSGSLFDNETDASVDELASDEVVVDNEDEMIFNKKEGKSRSKAEKNIKSFWKKIFSKKTVEKQEENSNED
jgi:hypothetical protein